MTPTELAEVKLAISDAMEPITSEVKLFRKTLFGNGDPGVCEDLRSVKNFILTLKATPKITWVLVSQMVTWGLVIYLAWKG